MDDGLPSIRPADGPPAARPTITPTAVPKVELAAPLSDKSYDRTLCKQRNRIERMFGYLTINRAVAPRCDQRAEASCA
ncbi:MAG: hypothetical protein V4595_07475 [Pseudomonadota bacterium]